MGFLSMITTTTSTSTLRQCCLRLGGTATRVRRISSSPASSFSTTPKYHCNSKALFISATSRGFSSTAAGQLASSSSSSSSPFQNKLGLGGNNWSRLEPQQYQQIIQTTLQNGITTIEAGQEGGDQALVDALLLNSNKKLEGGSGPLTVTVRIGYHTVLPTDTTSEVVGNENDRFPGDVQVEQHPFLGPNRTMAPLGGSDDEQPSENHPKMIQILHNITSKYIQKELDGSSLVKEYEQQQSSNSEAKSSIPMKVVALIHNPEAQIMALADQESVDINHVSIENRQIFLREKLVESFVALEEAVQSNKISSYGIVSNGLCLPPEHPLALSVDTILDAVKLAMKKQPNNNNNKCHLSVIQLPINLMERTGLEIARNLHERVFGVGESNDNNDNDNDNQYQHLRDDPQLEIYAMRPLTCYPDRGTGTGHAFRLVDYLLPSGPKALDNINNETDKENNNEDQQQQQTMTIPDEELVAKQWSNLMQGPPLIYSIALRKAMSHFDAEFILEEKLKRELTAEERETLDGCKLLQSMLHDLDHGLAEVRSLAAHEEDLMTRIIPLIHDTFEEYDEDTADVLQMFFKSYSLAVRYSIANNTRRLLREGGDDGRGFQYDDIPEEAKLQDYALEYLLKEKAIDRVIVGATQPDQVHQIVKVSQKLD